MNYYKLLKLNNLIKNPRMKLLGLYLLYVLNKRFIAVHFDPINACNLRCKMCYFTDKEYVKKLKGVFNPDEINLFSKAVLKKAIKLQIGCGTEPTLYKHLDLIFKEASKQKVPYISLTTNANLLEKNKLENWIKYGLNEITISLHGVHKKTYEEFMQKGDYNLFINSLKIISELKLNYPNFKLRVNYTFNEDNFIDLNDFWEIFDNFKIDILQIRPIQEIGNTEYSNFELEKIYDQYPSLLKKLKTECENRNTLFLAPNTLQLSNKKSIQSIISQFTYCYISPTTFWYKDFEWKNESFNTYAKRTNWGKTLFKSIFLSKKNFEKLKSRNLNYDLS